MRKFAVTVNGVVYDVVVEEVAAGAYTAPVVTAAPAVAPAPVAPAAPAPAPAAAPAPEAAPAPAPAAPAGAVGKTAVKAPFPGTVLKVNASVGASVKKGEVLLVLEAMKMENDICAPEDGVVASISVQNGASVGADDVLLTMN